MIALRKAVGLLLFCAAGSFAQSPAAKAGAAFDKHDISGNWDRVTGFETYSNVPSGRRGNQGLNLGTSLETAEAPFTPAGKAAFDKSRPGYGPRQQPTNNDPMGTCDPLGLVRNLTSEIIPPHATFEIVQTRDRVMQFFEWHHDYREIWIDGRALPSADDAEPKWAGYSTGKWIADTFVVDSVGFDERTWLDKFGYRHSENMKLQERYRRVDRDTLELRMTLTDPEMYSKPWESDQKLFKLNRTKAKAWNEQIYCAPTEEYRFNQVRDGDVGKK